MNRFDIFLIVGFFVYRWLDLPNVTVGSRTAKRGDCIFIPNAHQENPTRFTIRVDSTGSSVPDSVLDKLGKLKPALSKQDRQIKPYSRRLNSLNVSFW